MKHITCSGVEWGACWIIPAELSQQSAKEVADLRHTIEELQEKFAHGTIVSYSLGTPKYAPSYRRREALGKGIQLLMDGFDIVSEKWTSGGIHPLPNDDGMKGSQSQYTSKGNRDESAGGYEMHRTNLSFIEFAFRIPSLEL